MPDRLYALFASPPRTAEDWLVRLGRPSVSRRDLAAFEVWLDAGPGNLQDYETLKALTEESRALKAAFTAELSAIPRPSGRPRGSRWRMAAAPAFGALAALVAVVMLWPALSSFGPGDPMAGATVISSRIGEIRDVTLDDGSTMTLDTASAVRVKLEGDVRHVALDRGQAYFVVSHDAGRPFEVAIADRVVVVTGTRFSTALIDGSARVALLEGGVTLLARGAQGGDVRLNPGDAAGFRTGGPVQHEARFDPAAAEDWRARRRVFRDAPLSEVLAALSRYTTTEISAPDPAVARLRVTAVFPLDDDEPIVDRIDRLFPVTVAEVAPGRVEVRAEEYRKPVIRLE